MSTTKATALLLFAFALILPSGAFGQSHFTDCASKTGNDAVLVLPTSISPTVDGVAMANGDEIAVFTPRGTCAGAGVWSGSNIGITIWGDDIITADTIEGFVGGEALAFRVWDASASREFGGAEGAVVVSYSTSKTFLNGTGRFASNAIYELASLKAVPAPAAPTLLSPANGSSNIEAPVRLMWQAVTNGHSYSVQVSTTSDFQTLVKDVNGVIGTSYSLSGINSDQAYYWRVRAVSSIGIPGPHSTTFSFTTAANAPGVPELTSPANGAQDVSTSLTLSWQSVAEADSYDLQVSTGSDFASVDVLDLSGLTTTTHDVDGLVGGVTYYWRVRALNSGEPSLWSSASSFATIAEQTLSMTAGWNMVSSYIEPDETSLEAVLAPIASSLVLIKDGNGGVYWPDQGISTITTWDAGSAYLVYLTEPVSLTLTGTEIQVDQTGISLLAGWNSVAFWGRTSMEVSQAVQSISNVLVAVKNVSGDVYVPSEGVEMFSTLNPNAGYMIYVNQDADLIYPASTGKSGAASSYSGGGLAASATLILDASRIADGEIIVARTGSREIGRAPVVDGRAILVLRGDDPITGAIDGALGGDPIRLTRMIGAEEKPLDILGIRDVLNEAPSAELTYAENAIWTASLDDGEIPTAHALEPNYPNPFNPETTIPYSVSEAAPARLSVYNLLGQQVAVLVDEHKEAGRYEIRFDAAGLPSGSYIYRLESGAFSEYRQMIISK